MCGARLGLSGLFCILAACHDPTAVEGSLTITITGESAVQGTLVSTNLGPRYRCQVTLTATATGRAKTGGAVWLNGTQDFYDLPADTLYAGGLMDSALVAQFWGGSTLDEGQQRSQGLVIDMAGPFRMAMGFSYRVDGVLRNVSYGFRCI